MRELVGLAEVLAQAGERVRAVALAHRAVDVVWTLLDPVVHRRLTADRGWSATEFSAWLADALRRLLTG